MDERGDPGDDALAALLAELVRTAPRPASVRTVAEHWAAQRARLAEGGPPFDAAVRGGFAAEALGWAFAAGYQAAGAALFGELARSSLVALCATEASGAHPRAIRTTLSAGPGGLRLDGQKRYVTLGTSAERLLVVATEGVGVDGRPRLRVAAIPADRPGVTRRPLSGLPICPEIPHAELTLDAVSVAPEELLPGDGYLRYLKPFRTVEDLHVHGALGGWLCQLARRAGAPSPVVERLLAQVVATRALALADPRATAVHLAVGGLLAGAEALLAELEPFLARLEPEVVAGWERDRALLQVAAGARAARLEAARRELLS